MDTIEQLMIELGSEKAKAKSWDIHYDELHGKYQKLCDALYEIMGLEKHEIEQCVWIAKRAMQDVNEWPK